MFSRVLIANRGEIAVRVIRTCRRLGIHSVAVYSEADAGAMHVREADSAEYIGPSPAAESYLNIEAVLDAARRARAEAIHPGYGFLSENASLAEACAEAGIVFVGPSADAIRAMGDKVQARRLMAAAGVPVIPGYDGEDGRPEAIAKAVQEIGYPLMVKAAAGGGGRGMRVVRSADELNEALDSASREAAAAFGDGRIFMERLIEGGRHIEAQIVGDQSGRVVFLGERECSVQRRHQKVMEECPSPVVSEALRAELGEAARKAGEAVAYTNAGTVEFLLAPDQSFHFLEMNTRLQVEHPVTEEVFGVDLVEWQLRVAAGEYLPELPTPTGHAIEFRVYAEDPARGFMPSPGIIEALELPDDVRWDGGYEDGDEVPSQYDALLGKLIARGVTRNAALEAARRGLGSMIIRGPATNLALLRWLSRHPDVAAGEVDVMWLETRLEGAGPSFETSIGVLLAAAAWDLRRSGPWSGGWRPAGLRGLLSYTVDGSNRDLWYESRRYGGWAINEGEHVWELTEIDTAGPGLSFRIDGERHSADVSENEEYVRVVVDGDAHAVERRRLSRGAAGASRRPEGGLLVTAPMPGLIVKILVDEGASVVSGQPVAILEAMKMEHQLNAPADGVIEQLFVEEGQRVEEGARILSLSAQGDRSDAARAD